MTLPNFLIIGAMKSGTTALYQYLEQHPQVYMSPVKEPNFFAFENERPDFRAPSDTAPGGINEQSVTDLDEYRTLFGGVSSERAVGEASHWYLYSPKAPERIQHHIPGARIIAVLRNPVERAYSDFLHSVRDGNETVTDFREALAREPERIHADWSMGRYVDRGFYHAQLERYFNRFEPDRIRVYLYEDLKADASGVMKDMFQFLGVDETFEPNMSVRPNVSGVPRSRVLHALFTKPSRTKAFLKPLLPATVLSLADDLKRRNLDRPQIQPEIRAQLIDVYTDDILKLQELIRRDLSEWLGQQSLPGTCSGWRSEKGGR